MKTRAFTLVELLVVVAIIVVLLALLVPGMDKAIYQSELAVCGANQRATAGGATIYAMGNKRYYPYREGVRDDMVWPEACIYNGSTSFQAFANGVQPGTTGTNVTVYDDRRILRGFLSLNAHLNDPLTGKLDFERWDADSEIYSTFDLWFGYRFKGFKGMDRVGGRVTYFDSERNTLWRPDILVSDRDSINNVANPDERTAQSSHPDLDRRMHNLVLQNQDWVAGMKFISSYWTAGTGRGPVDLNFAFQDGSVSRYNRVGNHDLDMGRVPESNLGYNGWLVTVPPQK